MFHILLNSPLYFVFHFLYLTIVLHTASGVQRLLLPQDLYLLILGSLEAMALPLLIAFVTQKKRILGTLFYSFLIFYYTLLAFYHLRTKSIADFGMTFSNVDLLANSNSWYVIKDVYRNKDWIQVILFSFLPFIPYLVERFKQTKPYSFFDTKTKKIMASLIVIAGIAPLLFQYPSINKLTQYVQTGVEYAFPRELPFSPSQEEIKTSESFSKENVKLGAPLFSFPEEIQNVFIIFLESFNVHYVEKKTPEGKEYTPYFNKLISEGLYFENFYANSMQTAKGQFATLCSQVPHSKLKDMVALKKMKVKCLPSYFKELGFKTIFMQGLSDLNFDNTGPFLKSHGFDETWAMDSHFISKEESEKYLWGWGIQDNILFQKALEYRVKTQAPKVFMALATISHHMKFKEVPQHLKKLYPDAKVSSPSEIRFVNSLNVMDTFLEDFFKKLDELHLRQNSLVILLGDHSFPNGEHGNYSTENTFYNENFKTPLLILGPKIKSRRLSHPVSQIDIAPTLLKTFAPRITASDFQGKNLFDTNEHSIPLIQPYDGRYLSIIKGQKKFVYHIRTDKRYLFDLGQDPLEEHNLYQESDDKEFFPLLKRIIISDKKLEASHKEGETSKRQ